MKIQSAMALIITSILVACVTPGQEQKQLSKVGDSYSEKLTNKSFKVTEVVTKNSTMSDLTARMKRLGDKYCNGLDSKIDGLGNTDNSIILSDPNLQVEIITLTCKDFDPTIQGPLGVMKLAGEKFTFEDGVPQSGKEAFDWYKNTAEQGNPVSQFNLGMSYKFGIGTEKNSATAVDWFRRSANLGNSDAQFQMGLAYLIPFGVDQDRAEAMMWLSKAEISGNSDAAYQFYCSNMMVNAEQRNIGEVLEHIRGSASRGDLHSQTRLAWFYSEGKNVPQDYAQAIFWWSTAAEQGDMDSQFRLANLYANGLGTPKDESQAYKYWLLVMLKSDPNGEFYKQLVVKINSAYDLAYYYKQSAEKLNSIADLSDVQKTEIQNSVMNSTQYKKIGPPPNLPCKL